MGQTYDKPDPALTRQKVLELLDKLMPKDSETIDQWENYFSQISKADLSKLETSVDKLPPVKILSLLCATLEEMVHLDEDNRALAAQSKSHKERCSELNREVDLLRAKITELEETNDHPMNFKMG